MAIPKFNQHYIPEASLSGEALEPGLENIRKVFETQLSRLLGGNVAVSRLYGFDFIKQGGKPLTGIKFIISKGGTPSASFRLNWVEGAGDSKSIYSVDLWVNSWKNDVKTSAASGTDQPELNVLTPGVSFAALIGNAGDKGRGVPEKLGLVHLLAGNKSVKQIQQAWEGQAYESYFSNTLGAKLFNVERDYDNIFITEATDWLSRVRMAWIRFKKGTPFTTSKFSSMGITSMNKSNFFLTNLKEAGYVKTDGRFWTIIKDLPKDDNEARKVIGIESGASAAGDGGGVTVTRAPEYTEDDKRYVLDVQTLLKGDPIARKELFKEKLRSLFSPASPYDLLFGLGGAGIGKSFETEKVLEEMGLVKNVDFGKSVGSIEAPSFSSFLWKFRKYGQVALFDDCDNALNKSNANVWKNIYQDDPKSRIVGHSTEERYDADRLVRFIPKALRQLMMDIAEAGGDDNKALDPTKMEAAVKAHPMWKEFWKKFAGGEDPKNPDPKISPVNYLMYAGKEEIVEAFQKYLYPAIGDATDFDLASVNGKLPPAVAFFKNPTGWFNKHGKMGIPKQFPIRSKGIVLTNQSASLLTDAVKQRAFLAKLYYSIGDIFKIIESLFVEDKNARDNLLKSVDFGLSEEVTAIQENESPNKTRIAMLEEVKKKMPEFLINKNYMDGLKEVLDYVRTKFSEEDLQKMPTTQKGSGEKTYSEIEIKCTWSIRVFVKAFKMWVTARVVKGFDKNLWKSEIDDKLF